MVRIRPGEPLFHNVTLHALRDRRIGARRHPPDFGKKLLAKDVVQAAPCRKRFRMGIHPDVSERIFFFVHDVDGCGTFAFGVPACGIARLQRLHEALVERLPGLSRKQPTRAFSTCSPGNLFPWTEKPSCSCPRPQSMQSLPA